MKVGGGNYMLCCTIISHNDSLRRWAVAWAFWMLVDETVCLTYPHQVACWGNKVHAWLIYLHKAICSLDGVCGLLASGGLLMRWFWVKSSQVSILYSSLTGQFSQLLRPSNLKKKKGKKNTRVTSKAFKLIIINRHTGVCFLNTPESGGFVNEIISMWLIWYASCGLLMRWILISMISLQSGGMLMR